MRDYWIVVDANNIVVGEAEMKKDAVTEQEVMANKEGAVKAFKVSEEIFNEQRIGERFTTD